MEFKTKLVFIAIILVSASTASNASIIQEIGIKAGPNFGYLDYDKPMEIWDPGWGVGFTGGVLITIPLSEKFSLVPELRYSYLKNKVDLVNTVFDGQFSIAHNSISLPLLLRYEFSERTFFFDLGPEFALLILSKSYNDYNDPVFGYNDETDDISDIIKGYNILACARIGFNAHRWNIPVAFSIAYHLGLRGVSEEDIWWSDWKTHEFSMCLSYVYRFGN
ncbi:MAG: porin family protein [Candidatus Krumholzibacteriales bacterium]